METIYQLAVKLSLETAGIAAAGAAAMRAFGGVESSASRAERSVASLRDRLNSLNSLQRDANTRTNSAGSQVGIQEQSLSRAQAQYDALSKTISIAEARMAAGITLSPAKEAQYTAALGQREGALEKLITQQAKLADATVPYNAALREQAFLASHSAETVMALDTAMMRAEATAQRQAAHAARMEAGMNQLGMGALLFGGGLMGAGLIGHMVSGAGDFQNMMEQAKMSLARSSTQSLAQFRQQQADFARNAPGMFFDLSGQTMFSATTVAAMARTAAMSGLNNPAVLMTMMPTLAKAAEIEYTAKGASPTQTVSTLASLAHFFVQYPTTAAEANKKGGFNDIVNMAVKSSFLSGAGGLQEEMRTLQYLGVALHAYHLQPSELFAISALGANVGLTVGRGGGSRLGAIFARLVSGGSRSALANKERADIERIGGGNIFASVPGHPGEVTLNQAGGFTNVLKILRNFMDREKDQRVVMRDLNDVFQRAGATAIVSMANPGAVSRYGTMGLDLTGGLGQGGLGDINSMQKILNSTLPNLMKNLSTNMDNLGIAIGLTLLPAITTFLGLLVPITRMTAVFLEQHQVIAGLIGTLLVFVTTLAIVRGAFLLLSGAMKLMGVGTAVELFKKAAAGIAVALVPDIAEMGLFAGAAAILGAVMAIVTAPITLFIAAIVGLIALFVLIVMKVEPVRNFFQMILDWIHKLPFFGSGGHPSPLTPGAGPGGGHWNIVGEGKSGAIRIWVPDPPKPPPHKRSGLSASAAPQVHIHLHGMDHQSQQSYVKAISAEIQRAWGREMDNETNYGATGGAMGFEPSWYGV